jgi:hypothetical protein
MSSYIPFSSRFPTANRGADLRRSRAIPKPLTLAVCFFTALLGVQAQTAKHQASAQNLNAIHWSTSVDLGNVDLSSFDSGSHGASTHYGAPAISAANTVFVPVRTATSGFQINAVSGKTGVSMYTLTTDYLLREGNRTASYSPALATSSSGTRLYYAGAGGSVYYIEDPDSRPGSAPVQQVFYGLSSYQANTAGFNSTVFINTPITADSKGNIFFGFSVQGTAPAPLNTAQSGFARIDSAGKATYVLAGAAAGDNNIARDSRNSAPTLSNDESTVYVLVKAANTDSYGYLLGLDSNTLATKYKTLLKDPRNGNYATLSSDSTASAVVAPDDDIYLGVHGNPQDNRRGFLLHFSVDLSVEKVPGAFGGDFTPAIVPATMVASYTGSSSYLIFSEYNDYPGDDGGQGVNRIALLDPNSTQLDPHPSAHSLTEMREVLTASSITPDAYHVAAGFPLAVSEWSVGTPAVNPANNSVYVPNADGHIYRWDLGTNSLSQSVTFSGGAGAGAGGAVPVEIGPDGTIYTINGGNLFAAGDAAGTAVSVTSSAPDLRNSVAGDAVTFTAVVSSLTPGVVPTGTVTFQDVRFQDATPLSVTLGTVPVDATGKASLTTSGLQAGAHLITAVYSGSASATLVQSIHASATAVTLSSSPDALAATVTPSSAFLSRLPTGMVTFTDNNNVVAQIPLSAGTASFTITAPRAGTHVFGAIYSSDGTFAASAGTLAEGSRTSNRTPAAGGAVTAGSRATRPLDSSSGVLSGSGDYSQNPENLTLEGTSDWIHWGDPSLNRKGSGGSQISTFTVIGNTTLFGYQNDPRLLSWTDGLQTLVASSNNPNGVYVSYAGDGFSFTAPADTTMRTLVVHAGGYFSVGRLTAHLSDSSAPDFVDITSAITAIYDRNYVLTYKAASAGQNLTVSWVEVTDLGAGNVDLNAAALSLFSGTITPVSGNPESTAVGTAFPTPLQVSVTDANGNPVSGMTVTFTAPTTATGATGLFSGAQTATAVTDSKGIASAPALSANTVAGSYYVTANASGVPNTAQFSLTNAAGAPVSIAAVAGTPANAVVNTAFTTALQAYVKDGYGNPVSGATVTFSGPTSGAGALFASGTTATAVTNASGIAFAPALRANSQYGTYLVAATVATGVTPAYYTLSNTYGGNGFLAGVGNDSSATVNLTSVGTSDWIHWGDNNVGNLNRKVTGNSQISTFGYASTMVGQARTGAASSAQSFERRDSERVTKLHPENMGFEGYGNDIRPMNWSDGAPLSSSSNNGNGFYIDYGTYITSGRNGFTFTAPADLTSRTLTVYAGGNNSGGTLVAHLSDASAPDFVDTTAINTSGYDRNYTLTYSAASPGQTLTITWSMTSGTGNVTLSGSALSVGVPSTITATAGTPQSAMVNTAFGAPLQVTVVDTNNNPLSGVTVTFIAPGTGASATFGGSSGAVATTNTSGVAISPALTANGVGGSYKVTATLAGAATPAVFSLTNLIGGGSLSGSGNSSVTTANLTTTGILDWVHWGDAVLNRKSGVSPQISNYTVIGSQSVMTYNNDARALTWTDGTPTPASGANANDGAYVLAVQAVQDGFSFTAPADSSKRTLTVYVGGYVTAGMLTAHLSDQSAADFVDTTAFVNGSFDRNYTLTYNAASAGQTLTITWVATAVTGNVTLNGAALSFTPPSIVAIAGTPQSAVVNAPFTTALQAAVTDAGNNPVSGVTVTFTAPTTGASASFSGSPSATAVTNSGGIATAPVLTANGQLGNYTVTATVAGATSPASFILGNFLGGGSLSGSGNSSSATANLTTAGSADWVHWGDTVLNRKSGVGPQIGNYTVVGSEPVMSYTNDARALSWSDGTPNASGSNNDGLYVFYAQNGFSFTVPADGNTRTLSVYVGGWLTGGILTAHLSDLSAPDYVDITPVATSTYDRNYTLTFTAASPGQTLTVSWVATSGAGNVTWSGAALTGPKALTPQTISFEPLSAVNLGAAPFPVSATASSGLAVSFTSTTTGVCTVAGNTVTVAAAGLCSITASQAGNSTYAAAAPVTQSFSVGAIFQAGSFSLAQGASISLGTATLIMQTDGNLVLYSGGSAIWSTGTFGQNCGANKCGAIFQGDGNFVVYNGSTPLWSSGTFGNPGAQLVFSGQFPQIQIIGTNQSVLWRNLTEFSAGNFTLAQGASFSFGSLSLVMQSDGNLVLYSQNGPVWSTGSFGQNCGAGQCFANFRSDGNLVVYNGSAILWSSGTAGDPGAVLVFGAQSPQLQIIGSKQSVLWTDVSFRAGTFALSQGASVNFGSISLVMQSDGNLVLYQQGSPAVWSTGTWGQNCGAGNCVTVFQGDGNLVVYNGSTPLWSSGTFGNPAANLVFSSQAPQLQIISNDSVLWAK